MLWSAGLPSDNVELILQGIDSCHNSESQDNDQPDYDSVASDEDPVQEATCGDNCNDRRTKVIFLERATIKIFIYVLLYFLNLESYF